MKNETSIILGNVYKDIMNIKIEPSTTFDESIEMFYDVMRKHGIKQGELNEFGRSLCTPEWCLCWSIFKNDVINTFFAYQNLMKEIPNDLSHN